MAGRWTIRARNGRFLGLFLVLYLFHLGAVAPIHLASAIAEEAEGGLPCSPLVIVTGGSCDSDSLPPSSDPDRPHAPPHNEATCTVCAVGGSVLLVEVAPFSPDVSSATFVAPAPERRIAPRAAPPARPRAPPTLPV